MNGKVKEYSEVSIIRYRIELDGTEYIYNEYLNECGKFMEDELKDLDYNIINDNTLIEKVREIVASNTSCSNCKYNH